MGPGEGATLKRTFASAKAGNARRRGPAVAATGPTPRRTAWVLATWLVVACAQAQHAGPPGAPAAIWLAGVDPVVRRTNWPTEPSDFAELFMPGAAWARAAGVVRVFKVSTQFLTQAPEAEVQAMVRDLRRRGIALGVEALMQPARGACGAGVEGYSAPGSMDLIARRVRAAGGVISYVAMDEPLWYGHFYRGRGACAASPDAVARGVAENVSAIIAVFPQARIGDVEPVAGDPRRGLRAGDVMAFAAAYRRATGRPLDFFHADVEWAAGGEAQLPAIATELRAAGIRLGVIYNGDPGDLDAAWIDRAQARFLRIEGQESLTPDDALLQTWMEHPVHMLPETDPGAMTNLVLRYSRAITPRP